MGDLSGAFAANGNAGVSGITAAVAAANAVGGVDGHPIKLGTPIDTASTPDGAQQAAVQALSQKPTVMAGQAFSGGLAGMVPTLQQGAIPYVSSQGLDTLTGPTNTAAWMFTTSSTSKQQGDTQVAFLKEKLGGSLAGKTIAFVGLASPSVDATYKVVKDAVTAAGGTNGVGERTATGQVASFTAQAANIASSKPDAVITVDSAANTVIVAKALNDAGFTGPITTSTGANDNVTLKNINLPNLYAPRTYNSYLDSPTMTAAAQAAGVTSKADNAFFGQGYAAGLALVAGLQKCGFPCSPNDFIAALQTVGPIDIGDVGFGPLQFDAQKHYGVRNFQFFNWDSAQNKAVPSGQPIPAT
jgi:branched-chain amino acid transport system substrate-binding protein